MIPLSARHIAELRGLSVEEAAKLLKTAQQVKRRTGKAQARVYDIKRRKS